MYVVTVEFAIRAASFEPFIRQMLANARTSLETEPGCSRFDVCTDAANPSRVFLYELYVDRAAFDAHLGSEHFKVFDRTVAKWVELKTVRTWQLLA